MAKVTRIKASDSPRKEEKDAEPAITRKKVVVKDKKTEKTKRSEVKKLEKTAVSDKKSKEKKPFILIRPIVYLGRYLRDSWRELRQVRGVGEHRGGPPGLYAGQDPGRLLHHPGRGPEHLPGADENVPDPAGLRVQDCDYRRYYPDRPAWGQGLRAEGGHAGAPGGGGHCRLPPDGKRRGPPRHRPADHPGL